MLFAAGAVLPFCFFSAVAVFIIVSHVTQAQRLFLLQHVTCTVWYGLFIYNIPIFLSICIKNYLVFVLCRKTRTKKRAENINTHTQAESERESFMLFCLYVFIYCKSERNDLIELYMYSQKYSENSLMQKFIYGGVKIYVPTQ